MKMVKLIVAAFIVLAFSAGAVFAQEAGSSIGSSTTQIQGGVTSGNIIGEFPLTKPPVINTRAWSFGSIKFVYTDTLISWLNGKPMKKTLQCDTYFNGLLIASSGQTYSYDGSGKLMSPITYTFKTCSYDKNKRLASEILSTTNYDTAFKCLSSTRSVLSYSYNVNGALTRYVNNSYFYGGKFKLTLTSTATNTNTYNSDGSIQQEIGTYTERGPDGAIRHSSKSVTSYTYYDNGDSYKLFSSYDGNNKLCGQFAEITLKKGDLETVYRVTYDMDTNGNITRTQVYDKDGIEITNLSGEGYKTPADIITGIYNPADPDESITINVNGDMTLNSNKTWDLSKYSITTTGTFSTGPDTNGYDIYVNGDMTIKSQKQIDLSNLTLYVSGNLTIESEEGINLGEHWPAAGGAITITSTIVDTINSDSAKFISAQNIINLDAKNAVISSSQVNTGNQLFVGTMATTSKIALPIATPAGEARPSQ